MTLLPWGVQCSVCSSYIVGRNNGGTSTYHSIQLLFQRLQNASARAHDDLVLTSDCEEQAARANTTERRREDDIAGSAIGHRLGKPDDRQRPQPPEADRNQNSRGVCGIPDRLEAV